MLFTLAGTAAVHSLASCDQGEDPTCLEGTSGAGAAGATSGAAASGDGGSVADCVDSAQACAGLQSAITTCVTGWCSGAGSATAECGCWNPGMDLSVETCTCVPQNIAASCELYDLCVYNASTYDCAVATAELQNFCMP